MVVSLTPRFSEVASRSVDAATALAVYPALRGKTAKAVHHGCVSLTTPLKQGVNEISQYFDAKHRVGLRLEVASGTHALQ
jgi:hypothetical protein